MAEVTEKSFPFDSDEINGEHDREYIAEDFARYFSAFITSGVFMKKSTNLQVLENGDMTVTLKPGKLIIDGYRYDNLDDIIIRLDPADGVLNRIDRISGTWSKEDRDIHYTLQKGKSSYEPVPPECRRDADTKDYVFADVYIKAGAVSVTQADITDQRLNSEVCGIANPFNDIDTTSIFIQFTKWLELTRKNGEADVAALVADMEGYLEVLEISGNNQLEEILNDLRAWLNRMKGQLSEDAAGHLQVEIDELQEKLEEIETPDFDDSGEVEGIESFTDFMSSFVKGTSIYQFFAKLKAGFKYVLHQGQLVNNGTCDTPGKFPMDAAYGKTLTDLITQLSSELAGGITVRYNEEGNYIEVLYGGEWKRYPPADRAYYLIKNGQPQVPFSGNLTVANGYTVVGAPTNRGFLDANITPGNYDIYCKFKSTQTGNYAGKLAIYFGDAVANMGYQGTESIKNVYLTIPKEVMTVELVGGDNATSYAGTRHYIDELYIIKRV